jgi:hypothetical protein
MIAFAPGATLDRPQAALHIEIDQDEKAVAAPVVIELAEPRFDPASFRLRNHGTPQDRLGRVVWRARRIVPRRARRS